MVIADVFGRLDAQAALPALITIMADWRPDLVVREPCEFGSLVAAEHAGIPQAQVAIGMARWAAPSRTAPGPTGRAQRSGGPARRPRRGTVR